MSGRVYLEAKLEVRHVTAKLLFIGLIRGLLGLFRATEFRVA